MDRSYNNLDTPASRDGADFVAYLKVATKQIPRSRHGYEFRSAAQRSPMCSRAVSRTTFTWSSHSE